MRPPHVYHHRGTSIATPPTLASNTSRSRTTAPRPGLTSDPALRRRPHHLAGRRLRLPAATPPPTGRPQGPAGHPARLRQLQRRLNRALQGDLPKALRRRRQPLAIDLTLIPYHGEPLRDADEVYRGQAKSGTSHFHAYATAYVIRKGQRFTVALAYVRKGETSPTWSSACCGRPPRPACGRVTCCWTAASTAWRDPLPAGGPLPVPDAGGLPGPQGRPPQGARAAAASSTWKRSGWGRYTLTDARRAQGDGVDLREVPQLSRGAGAARPAGAGVRLLGLSPSSPDGCTRRTGCGSGSRRATGSCTRRGSGPARATRCCGCCTWGSRWSCGTCGCGCTTHCSRCRGAAVG